MRIASKHVSFSQIADLVEGRLDAETHHRLQAHTETCSRCSKEIDWMIRLVEHMRTDRSEDAPPQAIAQAIEIFQSRPTPLAPTIRQRIQAILRFDSKQTLQPSGVRARAQFERQLLYNIGDADLDMQLAPEGDLWRIAGQVLGPDVRGSIELEGNGKAIQASLNELGEFRLPPMPSGTYTLMLHLAATDVELVGLEVGL
jgi:hypothetical protein